MTTQNTVFAAAETMQIIGYETECECSHCGKALKVGVKVSGFGGAFGSQCVAKAAAKQTVGPYTFTLTADLVKQRALIAGNNNEARYGWHKGDANFRIVLKSALQSI